MLKLEKYIPKEEGSYLWSSGEHLYVTRVRVEDWREEGGIIVVDHSSNILGSPEDLGGYWYKLEKGSVQYVD